MLKLVYLKIISDFRNLKELEIHFFEKQESPYVLIGNNGAGKSSVLEAISSIFKTLYLTANDIFQFEFNFILIYKFDNHTISISNKDGEDVSITIDEQKLKRSSEINEFLPQRVICNYSGEENRIKILYYAPLWKQYEQRLKTVAGNDILRMVFIDKDLWKIILYIIIARRQQHEDFDKFLKDILNIKNTTQVSVKLNIDQETLKTWTDNSVKYYIQQLIPKIQADNTISINELNPGDEETLTMFNYLSSARSLIKDISITFNNSINSQYLSEGEKKMMVVMFILTAISDEHSLVLLDEPDSHIHIARKPSLAKMFQNAINRENILTTHSPSLSASLPAKSIVMLDGANGYAQVVNADNREVVERLTNGQWTLQQQNIFLASNKDIILVEGKTDETFLSKALTYFKQTGQFLDHDYDFLPCGGAPGVVLLKDRFIPKSNQHIYCFFDNDKAGWESINKIFNPPVKFDKRNFGKARKNINIWIAPYPHKKTTPSCDFNIEDYFKRNIFTRYVLKFRSLNEIMTKDRIKNEISDDCIKGQIHDKDFLRFSEVFELINEIKIADANSQNTVP